MASLLLEKAENLDPEVALKFLKNLFHWSWDEDEFD